MSLKNNKNWHNVIKFVSVALALIIWQTATFAVNNRIILVGPVETVVRLCELAITADFWKSSMLTAAKISLSFIIGFAAALLLAVASKRYPAVEVLLKPYIVTIQTVPVTSFIVIALLWLSSKKLSIFISFLIVLPILYLNMLQGLRAADKSLLEMAYVFKMNSIRKVRLIYIPALEPFVVSASKAALGVCWKAGIAAEVIGISPFSIGGMLYQAKVNLEISDLFAWTVMTVILSVCFEKLALFLIKRGFRRLEVI